MFSQIFLRSDPSDFDFPERASATTFVFPGAAALADFFDLVFLGTAENVGIGKKKGRVTDAPLSLPSRTT
jgi:hypothetical protein